LLSFSELSLTYPKLAKMTGIVKRFAELASVVRSGLGVDGH